MENCVSCNGAVNEILLNSKSNAITKGRNAAIKANKTRFIVGIFMDSQNNPRYAWKLTPEEAEHLTDTEYYTVLQ